MVEFPDPHRRHQTVRAVDKVSLTIGRGEILGLVGESGSGKTTLAKTVLRLYRPQSGRILLGGVDITHLNEPRLRPMRRQAQMVFQDPLSSFNPRHTIGRAIAIPLLLHRICRRSRGAGLGCAHPVRCRPAGQFRQPLSAPAFRRPVAAGGDRAGAVAVAGADRGGRGGLEARRFGARADPESAEAACMPNAACRCCSSPTTCTWRAS